MKIQRLCIVGGSLAGIEAAMKFRRENPEMEIFLFTQEEYIPYVELPYYFGTTFKDSEVLLGKGPDYFKTEYNIVVYTQHQVLHVAAEENKIVVQNRSDNGIFECEYHYLFIALCSYPILPEIEGCRLKNIFVLRDIRDALEIRKRIEEELVNKVVVVGGGIRGLQTAENLILRGIPTVVIDKNPYILTGFDKEIAVLAQHYLERRGITFYSGEKVLSFIGNTRDEIVEVHTPEQILQCNMVIWTDNMEPNVMLAQEAGIAVGESGGIKVTPFMETNKKDVYAIGDCVEKKHSITGKQCWYPAASSLYGIGRLSVNRTLEEGQEKPGMDALETVHIKLFHVNIGKVGLSAAEAAEEGYEAESLLVSLSARIHSYPGYKGVIVKLTIDTKCRRVIGVQLIGEGDVNQTLDTFSAAISLNAGIDDLMGMDFSQAPVYSMAENPVRASINMADRVMSLGIPRISPLEIKKRLSDGTIAVVDVRREEEIKGEEIPGSIHIPAYELQDRWNELNKEQAIALVSRTGNRAMMAHLLLKEKGFLHTMVLDGGLMAYPFK